jgi:hypothetical protein
MKKTYLLTSVTCLVIGFNTTAQETNAISEQGNVGIGTTTPTEKLQVSGRVRIDSTLVVSDSVTMTASASVGEDLKVNGNLYLPNIPVLSAIHNEYILLTNSEGLTEKSSLSELNNILYSKNCSAVGGIVQSPTWANGPNKLFSECPEVRVGIGTANPAYSLDVIGSSKILGHLWAQASLSVGATENPFSKLNVVNTNKTAAIQVNTVGNIKPYQRLMYFEYDNTDTKILEVQNTTAGYTAFSLKSNGEMDIHNGTTPIFHLGTDGRLVIRNNTIETFRVESNGMVRARKVKVDSETWPDYVFEKNYKLLPLDELEIYLQQNKHLPAVPSEQQIKAEGIDLAEMNVKMMEKIEELTLYLIQQNKELEKQNKELEKLKAEMELLKN